MSGEAWQGAVHVVCTAGWCEGGVGPTLWGESAAIQTTWQRGRRSRGEFFEGMPGCDAVQDGMRGLWTEIAAVRTSLPSVHLVASNAGFRPYQIHAAYSSDQKFSASFIHVAGCWYFAAQLLLFCP